MGMEGDCEVGQMSEAFLADLSDAQPLRQPDARQAELSGTLRPSGSGCVER
jgi:hypothetical protein